MVVDVLLTADLCVESFSIVDKGFNCVQRILSGNAL